MIYELSFRGQGGSVVPGQLTAFNASDTVVPRDLSLVSYDQVVFLIHGFNVKEKAGRTSLSKLAKKLHDPTANTAVVFVLWPGDSPIGPLSYPFTEGHQANDTAQELSRFIDAHAREDVRLNFVAHSLGCRVTLQTLSRLFDLADGSQDRFPVGEVCLFAAAVDDISLSIPKKYKQAAERADRVTVLSSVKDSVLSRIYPLGDLVQSFLFFWKESFGLALGYHGPRNVRSKRKAANKVRVKKIVHAIGDNVVSIPIPRDDDVDHGDYLPPDKKGTNDKQRAAARLAIAALRGNPELEYKVVASGKKK